MASQKSKSSKVGRKSKKPAQHAYVSSGRLEKNKVRRLMKDKLADGSPRFSSTREATEYWRSVRKRRVRKDWE